MSTADALQELDRTRPEWAIRLLGAVLTGLVVLLVVQTAMPRYAPAATKALLSEVTAGELAQGLALIVALAAAYWLWRTLSRVGRFYAGMCLLGAAHRAQAS